MVFLAVEGGVAQHPTQPQTRSGGRQAEGKLRRVVGRSAAGRCGQDELAAGVADQRQFQKVLEVPATPGAQTEVMAGVVGVEPRGIDGRRGVRRQQTEFYGLSREGVYEAVESPFFSIRAWAFCKVV